MEKATYENGIFEMVIESELPIHFMPKPTTKQAKALTDLIARLKTEANVSEFNAVDIGGGIFTTTVEHGGGTYSDQGQLVGGMESVTWPNTISDPYPIHQLAKLLEIRTGFVDMLQPFHPTLLKVEFYT